MKNVIPIVIIGILVLSGIGAAAFNANISLGRIARTTNELTSIVPLSQPVLREDNGFVEIEMIGATGQLIEPNRPVLPIYVKVFEIPFKSQDIQVVVSTQDVMTMDITKPIVPARISPLSLMHEATDFVKDESIYGSAELYPDTWYQFDLSSGRNDNNMVVTFVKVVCYPVRYSPMNNEIVYADGFDIVLNYNPPDPTSITETIYDMVIIAPDSFESLIQPLIDHKNDKGVLTTFKSMEAILNEYSGFDPPEQVKYFIKDAFDNWNITYALLFGGLKSHIYAKDKDTISAGYSAWHVPIRYVTIPQGDDPGCPSDLYYGCLYDGHGNFDSWDSNGDGVYAEWRGLMRRDEFDMNPEVYVGRLPVSNTRQVSRMVDRIIEYESSGPEEKTPWFNNFVGIGAKTFDWYEGKPDGEYLTDLAYQYMTNAYPDLELVTVYSTNRDTGGWVPDETGISEAISQGASYVVFQGHGNTLSWNNIWHDGNYPEDWVGGIHLYSFSSISNDNKRPVVTVGGCHNGLFNVSIIPSMLDRKGTTYFTHGMPGPVCFSWGLVIKPNGGAIASTGCTGYGMGYRGQPVSLSGELESNFYWQIGMNNATTLGQTHSESIQKFILENDIGQIEAFVITNWQLFGDPSLKLGGYSS